MSKPLHPKASGLQRAGLFAGLKSFDELETRITALPDERARGDAFEVFAEAYLSTQRRHDLPQVWPLAAVPTDVLRKLALPLNDYGVDGVAQTVLGGFDVYQVKFRSGRQPLTWRELSTFMGLADSAGIRSRVLFTNCDDLPAVMNERKGFFCIRGSDLDRLEESDFRMIESWLAQAQVPAARKQPRPHQHEALDVLLPALREHDRVTGIMACATGKTLVALWVAERMQSQTILVLLPSLALLRQTLHEWLHETSLPSLAYLCVCSDPTVKQDLDAIATPQSDLDFPVTTDRRSVREFLDAPFAGAKIIFSTYQSARVVGEALRKGETFDLGIFDEAHKTAGREGRNYAFALEDANLPIRKRLFLTATPRHYNPRDRDDEGEAKLVFSMDNPEVYGSQAYRLTFAEAARRGIICGYKIIISVITSEMVTNELLSRGEVLVNGDAVRARQVANQIALHDAIEKYGASKVFTFHKTVASAASFVTGGSEGVRTHLPDFETFHVNGTMPTARREREMRDFRAAARAVVSNARCLTEGVDVPAVDMVAFLSPRRSRVDIVQATGRAMRCSPGKTTGYVLVPLYVELAVGETVEAAVNRAEFDEVWDVLNSLQEQDDVLAELIRYVAEQKGRGKGFDDSGFADRIDFAGSYLSLESLRKAVTTRCFDELCCSWDAFFGKLKSFKDRFGHCNVSTYSEDIPLGRWVVSQRICKNKGLLSEEQIRRLDELGFVWDFQTQKTQKTWMKWYRELETYAREHGDSHVPRTHAKTRLASWVWGQRNRRDKTYGNAPPLTKEQVALLDKLGFRWDMREEMWAARFEQLKRFKEQHGHCEVWLVEGEKSEISQWVSTQRHRNSSGELQAERKAKLDSIGFKWTAESNDLKWQEMYECLKQYYAANGDADVPAKWKEDPKLAAWVSAQRQRRKQGQISDEEVRLLDLLGLTWKSREVGTWEDHLDEVAGFKAKNGNCEIPRNYPENPKLGRFVNAMRTQRNNGSLSADRIARLDALGFLWASTQWQVRFDELRCYKQVHGDCDVPTKWHENPKLGHWVSAQRQHRKAGTLHLERQRLLEELGFDWRSDIRKEDWTVRFQQLKAYKQRYGDCSVPVKWKENPQLGAWVTNQRHRLKNRSLPPEKQISLAEIGFE